MSDDFNIDGELFIDVRRAAAEDDPRYYLDGVLIEPHPDKGAFLVATNGRAMLVAHDKKATAPRSAVIKLELTEIPDEPELDEWGDPLPRAGFEGSRLRFSLGQGKDFIACFSHSWNAQWRRGLITEVTPASAYPDWRTPLKDETPASASDRPLANAFDPALLQRIANGRPVQMTPSEHQGGPYHLHFHNRPNLCGRIMPMRANIATPQFEAELLAQEGDDR